MKPKFLITLMASMSLVITGCGKNKNNEPPKVDPPVDPGTDPDPEALTPEQQKNANGFELLLRTAVVGSERYEEAAVTATGSYRTAYAEEIARENVDADAVSDLVKVLPTDFSNFEAVMTFVATAEEKEALKDVVYFAVALGKSFLRAEEASNESYKTVLKYAADLIDAEGAKMHANAYSVVEPIAVATLSALDQDFQVAFNGLVKFDENVGAKQVDIEAAEVVTTKLGQIISKYAEAGEGVAYFVDFVYNAAKALGAQYIPEDYMPYVEAIDSKALVEEVFSYIGAMGYMLENLTYEEEDMSTYVIDVINLLMLNTTNGYLEAFFKVGGSLLELIGVQGARLRGVFGNVAMLLGIAPGSEVTFPGIVSSFKDVYMAFLTATSDPETGEFVFDIQAVKDAAAGIAGVLKDFGKTEAQVSSIANFVKDVAVGLVVVFGGYDPESEEDMAIATEKASVADFTDEVAALYEDVADAADFLENISPEVYDFIDALAHKDYMACLEIALPRFLDFIHSPVSYEDLMQHIGVLVYAGMDAKAHFTSEEFINKALAVVQAGYNVDAAKALVADVAGYLANLKLALTNYGEEHNVDVIKLVAHDLVAIANAAAAAFKEEGRIDEDAVMATIDEVYGVYDQVVAYVGSLAEPADPTLYVFEDLVNAILAFAQKEEKTPADYLPIYAEVVKVIYALLGANELEGSDATAFIYNSSALMGVPAILYNFFTSNEFIDSIISIYDKEHGMIDFDQLVAVIHELATYVGMVGDGEESVGSVANQIKVLIKAFLITYKGASAEQADAYVSSLDFDNPIGFFFAKVKELADLLAHIEVVYANELGLAEALQQEVLTLVGGVMNIIKNEEIAADAKVKAIVSLCVEQADEICALLGYAENAVLQYLHSEEFAAILNTVALVIARLTGQDTSGYLPEECYLPSLQPVVETLYYGLVASASYVEGAIGSIIEYAPIYAQAYELVISLLGEEIEIPEVFGVIYLLAVNQQLFTPVLALGYVGVVQLLSSFVDLEGEEPVEKDADFSEVVYGLLFWDKLPLHQFSSFRLKPLEAAMGKLYTLAEALGFAKALVGIMADKTPASLAEALGIDFAAIDTAEEFQEAWTAIIEAVFATQPEVIEG